MCVYEHVQVRVCVWRALETPMTLEVRGELCLVQSTYEYMSAKPSTHERPNESTKPALDAHSGEASPRSTSSIAYASASDGASTNSAL